MLRRLVLVVLAAGLITGCGQQAASPSLEIGAIYPLSGPQAPGGRDELAGVETALQLAQSDGHLPASAHLRIIDATSPESAAAAVDTLVHGDHVPAILGTYGSTLSAAASARAETLKTIYWETGAVADPITAQRRYVFRTVATGSSLGRMAVTFTHDVLIPDSGISRPRVVIVRVDDIYGHSVGDGEQALAQQLGISVVDVVGYDPHAYSADTIASQVAADHPDFLWDVSYLDDGVAIWQALLARHVPLRAAIGTSSAFCMPDFAGRLGTRAVGIYAADKPDAADSMAALSPAGQALLARARAAYAKAHRGADMSISTVAGFIGAWTLFENVLPNVKGAVTPDSIRTAALAVDVPAGDSINGGGVKFGPDGALDEGQNRLAAAVVGQWQLDRGVVMKIVYPPAYAKAQPVLQPAG